MMEDTHGRVVNLAEISRRRTARDLRCPFCHAEIESLYLLLLKSRAETLVNNRVCGHDLQENFQQNLQNHPNESYRMIYSTVGKAIIFNHSYGLNCQSSYISHSLLLGFTRQCDPALSSDSSIVHSIKYGPDEHLPTIVGPELHPITRL